MCKGKYKDFVVQGLQCRDVFAPRRNVIMQNRNFSEVFLAILLSVLFFQVLSCSVADPWIGTYEMDVVQVAENNSLSSSPTTWPHFTFKADGTFESGGSAFGVVKGTYQVDSTSVTVTITEMRGEPPSVFFAEPKTHQFNDAHSVFVQDGYWQYLKKSGEDKSCEDLKENRDRCYLRVSLEKSDLSVCGNIEDEEIRDLCYLKSEAKSNLGAIRATQVAYSAEWNKYTPCKPSPPEGGTDAVPDEWKNAGGFEMIGFAPEGKVYYQYAVEVGDNGQSFRATATGDLDGDGKPTVFFITDDSTDIKREGSPSE
jgi:hypothetical protein